MPHRILHDGYQEPGVDKLDSRQIAQRSTWSGVPDAHTELAALHTIHVVPANASSALLVNPVDPGTVTGSWLMGPPIRYPVAQAGRRL